MKLYLVVIVHYYQRYGNPDIWCNVNSPLKHVKVIDITAKKTTFAAVQ